jgi:hypothetical protein
MACIDSGWFGSAPKARSTPAFGKPLLYPLSYEGADHRQCLSVGAPLS